MRVNDAGVEYALRNPETISAVGVERLALDLKQARDELARVTLQRDLYKKTAEQLQAALDMLSRGGA